MTLVLEMLNKIAGTPEMPGVEHCISRLGVYSGGCLKGSRKPPFPFNTSNEASPVATDNIKVVESFSQPGKCVLMDSGDGSLEAYLLDGQGMALERLNRTFTNPAEFSRMKHEFFQTAGVSDAA